MPPQHQWRPEIQGAFVGGFDPAGPGGDFTGYTSNAGPGPGWHQPTPAEFWAGVLGKFADPTPPPVEEPLDTETLRRLLAAPGDGASVPARFTQEGGIRP
jgi:hypothetical protein